MATMAVATRYFPPNLQRPGESRPQSLQHPARVAARNTRCFSSSSNKQVYQIEMEHNGQTHSLQVAEDETILEKALDEGLEVPHDCKLGVCMTCPAKLEQGKVDQSEGMLSDDVVEKGYTLLCVSYPKSDCRIRTIPEDELLSLQLVTSAD